MVALRIVLGIFEAGFFPGCVYLLSTWYSRCKCFSPTLGHGCLRLRSSDDMQKRYSVFYLIGCVASAFAGILAYGLMQMVGEKF